MNDSIEIINSLKEYLLKKEYRFYEGSFSYKGIRKNVPQLDGSKKDLYVVSFLVSASDVKYDSDVTYFAYFDKQSKELSYIIGPQSYESVE